MGRLRIVAGTLKGRRIDVPAEAGLRPTSERAREALFAILGPRVEGARVLDAYAGSGALGFEALSRGAGHIVFVEAAPRAIARLERTADAFGVRPRCEFLAGAAALALRAWPLNRPFDLILADPPWAADQARAFLPLGARLLGPGGMLVLERDRRVEPAEPAPGLVLVRTARYGRTCFDFYIAGAGPPSP